MNPGAKTFLKVVTATAALAVVGWIVASKFRGMSGRGDRTQVWFYDESEKELYAMPLNTIPPDKGIGGPSGDGVRAIVVGFAGYKHDLKKRKIAYLLTYTPELKQILDKVMAARLAGRLLNELSPSSQGTYFQSNTLVRLTEDSDWHSENTPEGRKAMNEWRSWRGQDGSQPVICVP
ncbi:MAG TPA: hypothetical protein VH413_12420 [Verrucomicrobiae bacterium]|jgi:hypothetical protein|nr:hypothetical protein [Verrucomicrobiae bacterium]